MTPFCKTDGLYFDGSHEPEGFKFNFDKDIESFYGNKKDYLNITPTFDSIEDYYNFNLHCTELNKTFDVNRKLKDDDVYTIEINVDSEGIE